MSARISVILSKVPRSTPVDLRLLAGEPTTRADSRRDISGYLAHRDYAPLPRALIPGRAAALRVDRLERRTSPLSPPAKLCFRARAPELSMRHPCYACKIIGQGTSGHGRAYAHEDSNLTARRLFRQRSIRGQTPLTLYSLDFSSELRLAGRARAPVPTRSWVSAGGIIGSGVSVSRRWNRGLRHPAKFCFCGKSAWNQSTLNGSGKDRSARPERRPIATSADDQPMLPT
jgi:hypothetical protein